MLSAFAFGILALLVTVLVTYLGSVDSSNIWQAGMLVSIYVGIYLGLTRFFLKDSLTEATSLVLRGIGRANRMM